MFFVPRYQRLKTPQGTIKRGRLPREGGTLLFWLYGDVPLDRGMVSSQRSMGNTLFNNYSSSPNWL